MTNLVPNPRVRKEKICSRGNCWWKTVEIVPLYKYGDRQISFQIRHNPKPSKTVLNPKQVFQDLAYILY